ncbi:hypothetical protein GWK08_15060 [Leptobacterium flavescens]|uniref:Uncharacterized protein n=1 Tax=Leptobacterium flavescens TaxID=472055 RepID=A0A6P0UNM7_9FLAO|nr:alpha/beta hydrolase-fold protein [Leptobacterium flavescens]NER14775.1 hypothetical protein [Leptobacterium flavescens]
MKIAHKSRWIATISLILYTITGLSQSSEQIVIGTQHSIQSEILNEERTYMVKLPEGYESRKQKYPVMLVLDGEENFLTYSGIVKEMNDSWQIPEMIIVAIKNIDRTRDYTPTHSMTGLNGAQMGFLRTSGGGRTFLHFIEQELMPKINTIYRTSNFKILAGHSFGGLVAGMTYLSDKTGFDAFIAMDPSFWWDDQLITKQIDQIDFSSVKDRIFYFSSADKYENYEGAYHIYENNINSHLSFLAKLKQKGVSTSNLKLQFFEDETHGSVELLSLYYGLKFIFKDYLLKDFNRKSIGEITQHYKTVYKGQFAPPEWAVNRLGYNLLQLENGKEKAIRLFELNLANYPGSFQALRNLAEAYRQTGENTKALEMYKKAVALNPAFKAGREAIKALRKLKE